MDRTHSSVVPTIHLITWSRPFPGPNPSESTPPFLAFDYVPVSILVKIPTVGSLFGAVEDASVRGTVAIFAIWAVHSTPFVLLFILVSLKFPLFFIQLFHSHFSQSQPCKEHVFPPTSLSIIQHDQKWEIYVWPRIHFRASSLWFSLCENPDDVIFAASKRGPELQVVNVRTGRYKFKV